MENLEELIEKNRNYLKSMSCGSCALIIIGLLSLLAGFLIFTNEEELFNFLFESESSEAIKSENPNSYKKNAAPTQKNYTTSPVLKQCESSIDLNGTWEINYTCYNLNRPSERFSDTEILEVEEENNYAVFKVKNNPSTFSGPVCGNKFNWSGTTPDYTETGTWTIIDKNNFTKESTFLRSGEKEIDRKSCTGTGTRQ